MARGDTGRERLSRTEQADAGIHQMGEALGTESQSLGTRSAPPGIGSVQPRPGYGDGPGGWRLSNWRLRTKLLAVLLIPLISAIVFGGLHVRDGLLEAASFKRTHQQVRLENATDDLIHQLQRERALSVARVAANRSDDPGPLNAARGATDGALSQLNGLIGQVEPRIGGQFRTAADNLTARMGSLRGTVDATNYPAEGVLRTYSQSIDALLNLGQQGVASIREPGLLRLTLATNAVADAQEAGSQRAALLNDVIRAGQFRTDQDRELLAAEARSQAALSDFAAVATPDQQQRYQDVVTGGDVDRANSIAQTTLAYDGSGRSLNTVNPQEWDAVSNHTVDLINQVGTELRGELEQESAAAAENAKQRTIAISIATLAALIVALAVALIIARSLLGSLRTLRRSALDVADRRLPESVQSILHDSSPGGGGLTHVEPIPVHSREEIGKVARSFDAVHSQALRLASEQALLRNNVNDLFVNLARRSQTLVQRQLALIDRLEQDEQDPDQLSSLFELDHLATRMRRNNENLLILGGTDLTRRMMRPVPLTEVVGAAVSEVEQYARIAVADSPDLAIQGRVVNDFVHLVAELLENATVFSNPDTEVTVRTAYRRQELVLEIRDRGVGIDAAELGEINERLTRPPEIDVAVSRRMGLYVVGQLAQRHDIKVDLRNNGDLEGGVTASVRLSGEFVAQLTPDGPRPMPDVQRVFADERETVDSGSHLGLAAAFGGASAAGRGDSQHEQAAQSQPTASAQPEPNAQANGHGTVEKSLVTPVWTNEDDSPEETERAPEPEEPGDYSVRVASGDTYGVTDVPRWHTGEQAAIRPDEELPATAEQQDAWPDDQPAADQFDGQCGATPGLDEPAPVGPDDETTTFSRIEDEPQDLFHSPYEAEKTQQITRPPDDFDWDASWSSEPASEPAGSSELPPLGTAYRHREADDAPTERLPIYEAVLSQWFREDVSDIAPSAADTGTDSLSRDPLGLGPNGTAESARSSDLGSALDEPSTNGALDAADGFSEVGSSENAESAQSSGGTLSQDVPSGATSGAGDTRSPHDPGWGSADVGWQAAEALVEQTRQAQETTSAGLPKRVPKSNLVPGSAAPRTQSPAPPKPAAPRSAEAVRGRMSNFQSGVQRGRHAKAEPVSTEPPRSSKSRPEEQE